jgi:hypothetical protein
MYLEEFRELSDEIRSNDLEPEKKLEIENVFLFFMWSLLFDLVNYHEKLDSNQKTY